MTPSLRQVPAWLVLLLGVLLSIAVYYPGLSGPLLLDDYVNLADLTRFESAEKSALAVIFGNDSGPLGRPVAMASFVLDSMLDHDLWEIKRTNLLIHLFSGLLVFVFLRRLFNATRESNTTHGAGEAAAALIAVIWLVLPIHVSSVLYIVQRMTLLSGTFVLLGLIFYLVARSRIEKHESHWPFLWIAVPVCWALAALSKEAGVLLTAFIVVLEMFFLRKLDCNRSRAIVGRFIAFGIALPAAGFLIIAFLSPEKLFGLYEVRDFTLFERLLTQPRALLSYVIDILLPHGPSMGLFHDHFTASKGLLNPPGTLISLMILVSTVVVCWHTRRTTPLISGGVYFFLAGHLMESTIFPLELYFEHRNYLPSIGILIATYGLLQWASQKLSAQAPAVIRLLPVLGLMITLVYAGATLGRATVWSSEETLYAQELQYNPQSIRMRSMLIARAIEQGDTTLALARIDEATQHAPPSMASSLILWRLIATCSDRNGDEQGNLITNLEQQIGEKIRPTDLVAIRLIAKKVEDGVCPSLDLHGFSRVLLSWIQKSQLPETRPEMWISRVSLARVLAANAELDLARDQANTGWVSSGHAPGPGVLLFQLTAALGDRSGCIDILDKLAVHEGKGDRVLDEMLHAFRLAVDAEMGWKN